jgi:hypothetical protein
MTRIMGKKDVFVAKKTGNDRIVLAIARSELYVS